MLILFVAVVWKRGEGMEEEVEGDKGEERPNAFAAFLAWAPHQQTALSGSYPGTGNNGPLIAGGLCGRSRAIQTKIDNMSGIMTS